MIILPESFINREKEMAAINDNVQRDRYDKYTQIVQNRSGVIWAKEVQKFIDCGVKNILDIGCSDGYISARFMRYGRRCTGIDLSPKMIAQAQKNYPGGIFIEMNASDLKFKEESFDGLWSTLVRGHIPLSRTEKTLNGFFRVLKPGGFFFLVTDKFRENVQYSSFTTPWKPEVLGPLLINTGFKIVEHYEDTQITYAPNRATLRDLQTLCYMLRKPDPLID